MDLLEYLVDVGRVGLCSLLFALLLVSITSRRGGLLGGLSSLSTGRLCRKVRVESVSVLLI